MENNSCNRALYSYQSPNLTDEEIIKHFVVRQNEFQRIMSEIKTDDMTGAIQHYLLIGLRGSGKSTLLRRIQAEVNRDDTLNKKLIVVYLSEEQAGVYRLYDLWDLIIREINARQISVDSPEWSAVEEDMPAYSKSLYISIQKALKKINRKLLLLLDNIDRIFDNISDDAHLLRELLTNYKDLRIIGGSTRMNEHYWKYDMPFYQFFRIIRMDSLTKEEVRELLNYWSDCLALPEIKQFAEKNPGKIETIRVLTDGMPRTLLNFIEILIRRNDQNGFEYLRLILDRATPIYQERLNYLPPAQRKVLLELSNFWDAVKVKPLTEVCKMPGKIISAQLNQLVRNEIVEKIKGQTKDNLYRLTERFFNLWLLMTQGGPKEKRQVKYLTIFLENWYSVEELSTIYQEHFEGLTGNKLKPDYAAMMSTALAHSKYITLEQRDSIIEKTRLLKETITDYMDYLPPSSKEIFELALEKINKGNYSSARDAINIIEQEDPSKINLIGVTYFMEKNYSSAENLFLEGIEKGDVNAIYSLAVLYGETDRKEEAEKYYLQAIEKGSIEAIYSLADFYVMLHRNEEAEKYFLHAIEKGHVDSLLTLALFYYGTNRNKNESFNLMDQYLLKSDDIKGLVVYTLILLWVGRMEEFNTIGKKLVPELITNKNIDNLQILFISILVHKQYHLAWQWFTDTEYGKQLKELIRPMYFVTAGLLSGKEQKEEILKPGPEIIDSINEISNLIKIGQKVYYG